jgi:hypothetical protein
MVFEQLYLESPGHASHLAGGGRTGGRAAIDVAGGMAAWTAAGYPSERRSPTPLLATSGGPR